MDLVIVESPTKAKTLSKILGKGYEIKASMGHIRDLPKKGMGVDIENNFEPEYEVPIKAKKTVTELKKSSETAEAIILATDPDREGEAIAWHLHYLLSDKPKKKSKKIKETSNEDTNKTPGQVSIQNKFKRVVFHELTESAIAKAFKHPGVIDLKLVDAQQARRVMDRLVGYKLSPLLWKKVRYGLSAGRVQSVAVRLVVERERERQAFVPEEYWSVDGKFSNKKDVIIAELFEKDDKKLEIKNFANAKEIENELNTDSFKLTSVKKSERQKKSNEPFRTSTLQQAGANVFGFTAKRTMSAAQKLFEKGHITYHRTDSLNLSPQFIETARDFIKKNMGAKFLPETGVIYKTKAKNAQEAHEAIRPTNLDAKIASSAATKIDEFTDDETKIYSLIWKRTLESQMLSAIYDQTTINIKSAKGYGFRTTGSVIKFEGWLAVGKFMGLDIDSETSNTLPTFTEGEALTLKELKSDQHFTQPPARYSDASLIKAMEELGIGRPSTYAPTITTIQTRAYVTKDGKYFVPTDVAYVVIDLLVKYFSAVVDYKFTALMEEELDLIAEGTREWVPVVREFYEPFIKDLEKNEKLLQKADITTLGESDEICPDCGKKLVIKLGKYGKFLSCTGYPDCKFAKPMEQDIVKDEDGNEVKDFGKCDKCADGLMILRVGKFGKFIACSNYPKCKNSRPFLEKIGMKCPKCSEGDVVAKKGKFGRTFYGCSRYPDCDFIANKNPLVPAPADPADQISLQV